MLGHSPLCLFVLAVLLGSVGCVEPPPVEACPDLDAVCPGLTCVEQKKNAAGCPICECAVQACLIADDCQNSERCNVGPGVCEPAPACTDGDGDTECPAACFGRCQAPGEDGAFCFIDDDCDGNCRFDNRFCFRERPESPACGGWCVSSCDAAVQFASDPFTGQCFDFADTCTPPGWRIGC